MQQTYEQIAGRVMSRLMGQRGDGNIDDHMTLDTWEWPQGVAVYAMMKVYDATEDASVLDKVRAWYDGHILKGLPHFNVNTMAPMLGLTYLYEETQEMRYEKLIKKAADWVMKDMPRTQEGGLQHITSHDINEQQLWDDTLFMTVLFLYRAGRIFGQKAWCDEAEYQFLLHIKYLSDDKTALWYHGFCFIGRHHFGNAFWARGNSWFTAGGVDFVEMLGEGAARTFVFEAWRAQCEALVKLQDESGLWHTLLDDADSYLETSASAAIVYGLLKGARLGLLSDACRSAGEKGLQAVLQKVAEDGTVLGVSYGTPMGKDLAFYKNIPICPTAYGQGLVFLMLTEAGR